MSCNICEFVALTAGHSRGQAAASRLTVARTSANMYHQPSSVRNVSSLHQSLKAATSQSSQGVKRMALGDFENLVTIAKGSFGVVYKAVRKDNGRVYALKQVNITNMNRAEREEAVDEARVLAEMDSKYVIKYYDCFLEDGKLNIVMQFAPNGTLHSRLHAHRGQPMSEDNIWKFFIQALLGLRHIHSKKIIHRDMKSLNLFFDAGDNVLVGDLGIAKVLSPNTLFARTIVGTPYYLSPELCEDKPYNEKSDVWALGVVLYEMCTGGKHPFDAQNEGALIRKIMKGVYPPLPAGKFSAQLSDILRLCLTMDYKQRPDTAFLLRNPALASRARSLCIELDPDAKNESQRPSASFITSANIMDSNAIELYDPAEGREAILSKRMERQPLAEMVPTTSLSQHSWELPANPHLQQQIRSSESSKIGSQRVHYPGVPPIGHAGVEDDVGYPEPEVTRPVQENPMQASAQQPQHLATGEMALTSDGTRTHSELQAAPPPLSDLVAAIEERKQALNAARATGRGNAAAEVFKSGFDCTDPFLAHQMAKLGVNADEFQEAVAAAAAERNHAMHAAKANGRGAKVMGLMGGYGGEVSFKGNGYGQHLSGEAQQQTAMIEAGQPMKARPQSNRPYDLDADQMSGSTSSYRTASMEQSAAVRNAKYEAPKFARKRATDLMITGPSMRASGPPSRGTSGGSSGRVANFGYAASLVGTECTTTVAPTSYYNP